MKTETNIYKKLLAFQKLGISVKKSSVNPHFKSHYADLNEVLDKVKKPLNDLGIVILFSPQAEGLGTTLHDTESGTEITSFMKYVGNDNAQKTLACNTYFRRGSIVSLLGLEDEDQDGNNAVQAPVRKVEQKVEQTKEFVEAPIEKIKACSSVAELTALWNFMHPQQQASEHILEAFKTKSKQLKSKSNV
jgi:hypothetical protein